MRLDMVGLPRSPGAPSHPLLANSLPRVFLVRWCCKVENSRPRGEGDPLAKLRAAGTFVRPTAANVTSLSGLRGRKCQKHSFEVSPDTGGTQWSSAMGPEPHWIFSVVVKAPLGAMGTFTPRGPPRPFRGGARLGRRPRLTCFDPIPLPTQSCVGGRPIVERRCGDCYPFPQFAGFNAAGARLLWKRIRFR